MRSIDNLREYALTAASVNATTRAVLAGYIDNIDREVAEVRDRDYRNGVEDGEMAAERDGWVRLPVDADGVPIHVGDVLDKGEVTCIRGCGKGWEVVIDNLYTYDATSLRHHHAPTVEDVLREFAYGLGVPVADSYVAATAAKLRLAGDE